jgi:hypothetical protein
MWRYGIDLPMTVELWNCQLFLLNTIHSYLARVNHHLPSLSWVSSLSGCIRPNKCLTRTQGVPFGPRRGSIYQGRPHLFAMLRSSKPWHPWLHSRYHWKAPMSRGASGGFVMFRPMVWELLNIEKKFVEKTSKNPKPKIWRKLGQAFDSVWKLLMSAISWRWFHNF